MSNLKKKQRNTTYSPENQKKKGFKKIKKKSRHCSHKVKIIIINNK